MVILHKQYCKSEEKYFLKKFILGETQQSSENIKACILHHFTAQSSIRMVKIPLKGKHLNVMALTIEYARLLAQLMLPFPLSRGEVLSTHSSLAFIILLRWWISVLLSHMLNETYIAAEISRNKLDQVQEEYIPKALCRVCSNRQTSQRLCAITASSVFLIPPCHVHVVEEL